MKKIFVAVIVVIALAMTFATILSTSYVGDIRTHKFHYSDCSAVSKMNPANRVIFNTRDEAVNAGYISCKHCKP